MFTNFKRIVKFGLERFARDKTATAGALIVMIVTLSIATGIFLLQGISNTAVETLQQGVDISAYFEEAATEDEILQARQEITTYPGVAAVEYVSRDEALKRFRNLHEDDEIIVSSLNAVGQNPLKASLNIKTQQAGQYREVVELIESSSYRLLVAAVDFRDRVFVINRVSKIVDGIESGFILMSVAMGFIAALVSFNTIRLTIYNSKEEIEVMRLVGASNWFIRGPFIIQGMLVGILAAIVTALLFWGFAIFISPKLSSYIVNFDLAAYFTGNILFILSMQFGIGIGLGIFSSLIAISRYLKF